MKVSPKLRMQVFTRYAGHLNSSFVHAVGHFCFQKILMPGGRPGRGGMGTAGNDMHKNYGKSLEID